MPRLGDAAGAWDYLNILEDLQPQAWVEEGSHSCNVSIRWLKSPFLTLQSLTGFSGLSCVGFLQKKHRVPPILKEGVPGTCGDKSCSCIMLRITMLSNLIAGGYQQDQQGP